MIILRMDFDLTGKSKDYIGFRDVRHRVLHLCRIIGVGFILFMSTFVWVPAVSASQPDPPIPEDDSEVVDLFGDPPPPLLLPDLRTLPLSDLHLSFLESQDSVYIRFTNTILNSGAGALEMRGAAIQNSENIQVNQRVFRIDGTFETFDAGLFYFEDTHNHWHWENFSVYRIWSLKDNQMLDQVLASSEKVGYCLVDHRPYTEYIENLETELKPASLREYHACTWFRQGISVGWTDTYKSHYPGQYVDITHLADGIYALESVVDPSGVIYETNQHNNAALVYFMLENEEISVFEMLPLYLRSGISYDIE